MLLTLSFLYIFKIYHYLSANNATSTIVISISYNIELIVYIIQLPKESKIKKSLHQFILTIRVISRWQSRDRPYDVPKWRTDEYCQNSIRRKELYRTSSVWRNIRKQALWVYSKASREHFKQGKHNDMNRVYFESW